MRPGSREVRSGWALVAAPYHGLPSHIREREHRDRDETVVSSKHRRDHDPDWKTVIIDHDRD